MDRFSAVVIQRIGTAKAMASQPMVPSITGHVIASISKQILAASPSETGFCLFCKLVDARRSLIARDLLPAGPADSYKRDSGDGMTRRRQNPQRELPPQQGVLLRRGRSKNQAKR
ncbi:unnamed protein product, partial [Trichogramma brassicae]